MSDNGEPQAQQQQAMKCLKEDCQKEFVVMSPTAEVVNSMTVSMLVWAHPDIQACPHCGTPYQMAVRRVQGVEVIWRPLKTQRDAGIVVPPPGFRLPKPS